MNLTAKRVAKLTSKGETGRHLDSNGLYLIVTGKRTGHWERRYELHGVSHWTGLGSVHAFSLAEARERNRRISQQLADGIDPLAAKRAAKAALLASAATKLSFKEATLRFVEQRDAAWTNAKHAREYLTSLQRYAWPHLGRLDVAMIDVPHILAVLEQPVPAAQGRPGGPLWIARTVSADRLRNRIESVLSWSAARGYRPKGLNPAAWSNNLEHVLPPAGKVARVEHHRALGYGELPTLMAELATREGVGVKAVMFLVLCAARAGEILGAVWDEINVTDAVWVIPPSRMKGRREHRVPLSKEALALIETLPREPGNPHLFVGARNERLGDAAMSATLRRAGCDATIHGMRAAFSTWAHEQTAHSNHTIELSLAHTVGSAVEQTYRRSDLFNKRRQLMQQWAKFCTSPPPVSKTVVVPMRERRGA